MYQQSKTHSRKTRRQIGPCELLRTAVLLMLERITDRNRPTISDLHIASEALEALPLSTTEYHDIEKRIFNAVAYCKKREFGAAKYELSLLLKRLPRPEIARPQRQFAAGKMSVLTRPAFVAS